MRILLVTQYFYPEQFKSNDLAFELQKRGHQVTVLTGLPNYPGGKFYKGYGVFKKTERNGRRSGRDKDTCCASRQWIWCPIGDKLS